MIIPLSRQDYVAIPMPLGFHVFPNIGRKLVEFAMHDDPTKNRAGHLADMALIALNAYNPLGGADNIMQMLTPTPFDPVVALMENKDWTGKPIYKEQRSALDPKPGHTMGKDSVTPVARGIAYYVNLATGGNEWRPGRVDLNPDAIEYLFGQLTGGVGREATKAANMATSLATGEELAPHQITLAGRFYGNTRGVNGQSTAYYENLKRMNTSMAEAKGRVQQGEDAEAVLLDVPLAKVDGPANVLDKRVSDLVKMRRQIQKGDSLDKRALVKEVNAQIEQSMYLLNQAVEDALSAHQRY
ncbi:LPD38 domain-containing protein [Acidovorax sp. FG27]|uniref:LPD38 domain-containing protein n=1 Tax=Acidovorax sp. FG27 TaxID=3133652 RepID=UPI00333F43F2